MKDTVLVFARAPRLGTVKRRLARDIGQRMALRFHRDTLVRLLLGLRRDRRFRTVLAITPDGARDRLPVRVFRVGQGGGDIGARMDRACRRFPRGNVVIIGCDIPEAGELDVVLAFRALGRGDAVFGPAEDGGYWLVGLGPRRPFRPFAKARWSSPHALADTLANFAGRRVLRLRVLSDVDTAADWRRLVQNPHGPSHWWHGTPHLSEPRFRTARTGFSDDIEGQNVGGEQQAREGNVDG